MAFPTIIHGIGEIMNGVPMKAFPATALASVLTLTLALAGAPTPAFAVPDGPIADAAPAGAAPAPEGAMAARLAYNLGYEEFEKAQSEEIVGLRLNGAKAKASADKVRASFLAARAKFEDAAKADPTTKEAWNLIGYTSRRLGEYEKSLAAYEKALALNPTYSEAIEYRAEAYLALNRLDDAKSAYLTLFASSRNHASVLMESMQKWVAERRRTPAGVAAADIDAFAKWVEERAAVAQQTASLNLDRTILRAWN
jgi:tetratricopeptide (TPR) repeat protein